MWNNLKRGTHAADSFHVHIYITFHILNTRIFQKKEHIFHLSTSATATEEREGGWETDVT